MVSQERVGHGVSQRLLCGDKPGLKPSGATVWYALSSLNCMIYPNPIKRQERGTI